MKTKVCPKCGIKKLINEFYFRKDNNTYRSECKVCILKQRKKYRLHNLDKIQKTRKRREQEHPELHVFQNIQTRCTNPNRKEYNRYAGRGIQCKITKEEIRQLMIRDGYWNMKYPNIDRIDNNGDYTFENCRFIERAIHVIKDKGKPILQFDLKGNFIKEWVSTRTAALSLNCEESTIRRCLKGEIKKPRKFIWKYKCI